MLPTVAEEAASRLPTSLACCVCDAVYELVCVAYWFGYVLQCPHAIHLSAEQNAHQKRLQAQAAYPPDFQLETRSLPS